MFSYLIHIITLYYKLVFYRYEGVYRIQDKISDFARAGYRKVEQTNIRQGIKSNHIRHITYYTYFNKIRSRFQGMLLLRICFEEYTW